MDSVALVTGANGGIGSATALKLERTVSKWLRL
jgi:NAD(P)-dependent dehydrogenase (short-subunit alcohol dehydrogenase family)